MTQRHGDIEKDAERDGEKDAELAQRKKNEIGKKMGGLL